MPGVTQRVGGRDWSPGSRLGSLSSLVRPLIRGPLPQPAEHGLFPRLTLA